MSTAKSHLGDPYLEMAKDLIVPLVYTPSVENLHSLILLSWGEYGTGRENGLNLYSAVSFDHVFFLLFRFSKPFAACSPDGKRAWPWERRHY